MTAIDPEGLLQEALAAVLTDVVRLMPLHVTLVIHREPVMTEDEVVWSVPVGRVTAADGEISFEPVREAG